MNYKHIILWSLLALITIASATANLAPLVNDTLAYYTFNTSSVVDITGNYGDATLVGIPSTSVGTIGTAYAYNGITQYSHVPKEINLPSSGWSINFWQKPGTAIGGSDAILYKNAAGAQHDFSMYYYPDVGTIRVVVDDGTTSNTAEFSSDQTAGQSTYDMFSITYNGSNSTVQIWKNGVYKKSVSCTSCEVTSDGTEPWYIAADRGASLGNESLDELAFFNSTLNPTQINEFYNGGNPNSTLIYPYTPGTGGGGTNTTYFTLTASDAYTSSSINTFNATINNTFYSTTNGTINTNYNQSKGYEFDVYVRAPNHYNATYTAYNTSTNKEAVLKPYKYFTITAQDTYAASSINTFNATINGNDYTTSNGTITTEVLRNNGSATYAINVTKTSYFANYTASYDVNSTGTKQANLYRWTAIYARDGTTNASINNFSSLYHGTNYTTTTGTIYLPIYDVTNQTINASGEGTYTDASDDINASPYLQNHTFTLYANPSVVQVYIYDADTGNTITENITLIISGSSYSKTHTTTSGSIYADGLAAGSYTFTFNNENYTTQTYTITIGTNTYQTLNAYLSGGTNDLRFIIRDYDSAIVIENVTIVMQRIVNNTWVTVESKLSDITGRSLFQYVQNVRYRFSISKTGFQARTFELNPIDPTIATTGYTVRLQQDVTQADTQNYAGVAYSLTPSTFTEGVQTITYTIFSPDGALSAYNVSATYPGGSGVTTGTNAYGETLHLIVNISGAQTGDTINITYTYTSAIAGTRTYSTSYFIDETPGSYTWNGVRNTDYGFTTFEKALIAIVAVIFVAGFAFLFTGPLGGGVVGVLMLGFMYYIGFLSLWTVLPSLLAAVFIIIWRASA